ncbi:MAG: RNA methyltransferase [Bdellovibrionota bacterium]
MKKLSSASNADFKDLKALFSSRGIKRQQRFLLMGEKIIQEFLVNPSMEILGEVRTEKLFPVTKSEQLILDTELFNDLDEVGTHYNILVVALPEIPEHQPELEVEGLEVVTPLGDPNNLGALIRSAVAFGSKKIILTEEACHPYHPRCIKGSAGAVVKAPLYRGRSLRTYDTQNSYALDMTGTPLDKFVCPPNFRLVVGEEGPGLNFDHAHSIAIPTQGVESLNATVAASVALYVYKTKNQK